MRSRENWFLPQNTSEGKEHINTDLYIVYHVQFNNRLHPSSIEPLHSRIKKTSDQYNNVWSESNITSSFIHTRPICSTARLYAINYIV